MEHYTEQFGTLYHPQSALLIYKNSSSEYEQAGIYVEAYDINKNGQPINAHPLTISESMALAQALDTSEELNRSYLKSKSLLPENILYINPEQSGFAIWHTPAQQTQLLFADSLHMESGKAYIPPLVWKATTESLFIYAVKQGNSFREDTILYHAPFFNIYKNGNVCMGTVDIDISSECFLEDFMQQWQEYFFNSYFSHLIQEHNPVQGDIAELWKDLIDTSKKFPVRQLKKNGLILKNLF